MPTKKGKLSKAGLLNPCIYLSSISWSFLRATSHCCSPIVWSISSQGMSNMAVSGPLPSYWLATSPAACWPAQRIHSSVLGFKGQFLAPVSLFFRTGQLGNKVIYSCQKEKCAILQEKMIIESHVHVNGSDTLWKQTPQRTWIHAAPKKMWIPMQENQHYTIH